MSTTRKRPARLLSVLLTLCMMLTLLPTVAFAEDTRTEVSTIQATAEITAPVAGEEISNNNPTFTVIEGSPAYFNDSTTTGNMTRWQRKDGDTWKPVMEGQFTEGTWRIETQIRIDTPYNDGYVLGDSLSVTVNGSTWQTSDYRDRPTYSLVFASSPEYTVTADASVTVPDAPTGVSATASYPSAQVSFTPPANNGGAEIFEYKVTAYPGGKTVTGTSSPIIVSGLESGTAYTFTVQAKNAKGYSTPSLPSAAVTPVDTRTEVSTIQATAEITAPVAGEEISNNNPTFTVIEGSPAYFNDSTTTGNMTRWQRKDGDTWKPVMEGQFTEGTWRIETQIRIDTPYSDGYVLGDSLSVTVNGSTWQTSDYRDRPTYSLVFASSPEYTVKAPPALTGRVQYTSGATPGQKMSFAIIGLNSGLTTDALSYQWQEKDGDTWTDISAPGGTARRYEPTTAQLGKEIRMTYTAAGYTGTVAGGAITVVKPFNFNIPDAVWLKIEKDSLNAYTVLQISSYTSTQEYVYSTTRIDDTSTINWETKKFDSDTMTGLTAGETYYVYTRFKETADTQPGFRVAWNSIALKDTQWLQKVKLEGYTDYGDGNTIYIPVGGSITINVSKNPSGATSWSQFNFKLAISNRVTFGNDNSSSVTVSSGAMPATLKINAGSEAGSATLGAYYNDLQFNYGTWSIVVYDPANITTSDIYFTTPPAYGDIMLTEGDSFTPAAPASGLMLPTEANSQYHYEWRVWTASGGTGPTYGLDNGYIKVDPTTGEVTALNDDYGENEWKKNVALRLVKDGASGNGSGVCGYKATVNAKGTVALEGISVIPSSVEMTPGSETTLTVVNNPINAEVAGSVAWDRQSGSDKITVNESGKVTVADDAPNGATAVIRASLGGKTATCTVTVDVPSDHTHSWAAEWTNNDTHHWHECEGTGCDLTPNAADSGKDGYGAHTAGTWIIDTPATATVSGSKHKECSSCKYIMETATIPATGGSGDGGGYTPSTYTLTFNANGGSAVSSVSKASGTTVDLAAYKPVRNGYDFAGWYSDSALTTAVTSVKLTKNTTVYAKWTAKDANPDFPFVDVPEDAWYKDDVKYVYDKGLMEGTSDTTFAPLLTTTRGMITTILYRLEGEPAVSGTDPFDDVAPGKYYTSAVTWAAANGIVGGYGNGNFGPDDNITREQMAAILFRYAQYKGYDVSATADLSKFTDIDQLGDWAVPAMRWANANELVTGKGGGILDPKGEATRAQVAAILHRFCENIVK